MAFSRATRFTTENKNMTARLAVLAAVALALVASTGPAWSQSNSENYGNPHWFITLTDYGYSDFLIYTLPPFPVDGLHEMLSGEWGAAIWHGGMTNSEWLEPQFVYPDWMTNSTFTVVQPIQFPSDTDADGIDEGSSIIRNADFEIEIQYDFEDTVTGVAMGKRGGDYVLSDRYVLYQTYIIRNISGGLLSDVRFHQFMHPHPANTETATANIVYDPDLHADGFDQAYRYDVTGFATNSGLVDGSFTGSTFEDHVNFARDVDPDDWGLGHYRGHAPGKPVCGLHCDVESGILLNELTFGPDEVAGAETWFLGDIPAAGEVAVTVHLAVQSRSSGDPAEACLHIAGAGNNITTSIAKGLCSNPMPAATTYDVTMGSLDKLSLSGDGLTILQDLRCLAEGHTMDRLDLPGDAHLTDPLYFVVRDPSFGNVWGAGSDGNCSPFRTPPCWRVQTLPTTAGGLDVCP